MNKAVEEKPNKDIAIHSSEMNFPEQEEDDSEKHTEDPKSTPMIHPIFSIFILLIVGLLRRQQN